MWGGVARGAASSGTVADRVQSSDTGHRRFCHAPGASSACTSGSGLSVQYLVEAVRPDDVADDLPVVCDSVVDPLVDPPPTGSLQGLFGIVGAGHSPEYFDLEPVDD